MKLVSFSLPTPTGPQVRIGALDAAGGIVDLAAACRAALLGEGLTPAATRLSAALLPGDMVALIEGGGHSLDAARCGGRQRRGQARMAWPSSIQWRHFVSCRPCPGRRCCVTS